MTGFRSGLVTVVGRPNVGKSTLVNTLVGRKVAIVSNTPQTTRRGTRGILSTESYQIVFTDTPGFHKPKTSLGKLLNDIARDSVDGVDVVVQVVDAAAGIGRGDAVVFHEQVERGSAARFCAVNKVDGLRRTRVVPQLAAAAELGEFDEIVPVSARSGEGVPTLLELLVERIPQGPPLYADSEVTDQPIEVRLAELVREQALRVTRREVPHSVAVVVDELERADGLTRVHASVVVERDSQKPILIGAGGETLKLIGTRARQEMELLLGSKVFLDLRVRVEREWQRDPRAFDRLGLYRR